MAQPAVATARTSTRHLLGNNICEVLGCELRYRAGRSTSATDCHDTSARQSPRSVPKLGNERRLCPSPQAPLATLVPNELAKRQATYLPAFVTYATAAERLAVSRRSVERLVGTGDPPAVAVGSGRAANPVASDRRLHTAPVQPPDVARAGGEAAGRPVAKPPTPTWREEEGTAWASTKHVRVTGEVAYGARIRIRGRTTSKWFRRRKVAEAWLRGSPTQLAERRAGLARGWALLRPPGITQYRASHQV